MKLQRGTTSHQAEWPSLIILQINAGGGVEKREPSYTVGGNVSWSNQTPHSKRVWRFLKKLNIELPYDPAIPLPDIYQHKTVIQKDACTPMFISALFTIAKTWKQHKRPLTEEWIKKMWYIYTMEYYSAIKNEIMPFAATWMAPEIIILRKV